MSTRCQISFRTTWRAIRADGSPGARRSEERWVYRHWDGDPERVIPDLIEFVAWHGGLADEECAVANFLYWNKREPSEASARSGFGVCTPGEFHDDIEYFYEVVTDLARPDELRITPYTVRQPRDGCITRAHLRRYRKYERLLDLRTKEVIA